MSLPEALEDAIGALSEGGEDAKVLAGGHSLLPLMKLRLATRPCSSICAAFRAWMASSAMTASGASAR